MIALKSQVVNLHGYNDKIRWLMKRLDLTNVRIFSAMQKFGPRNLLEVSRRTGIPFTSVYNRVNKLEATTGPLVHLNPMLSKLGLVSLTVLTNAKSGYEDEVKQALRTTGYCRAISRCEGGFTHHSEHAVPYVHIPQYRKYLKQISSKGLATSSTILATNDYRQNPINFHYYDAKLKEWRFRWATWLNGVLKQRPSGSIDQPTFQTISFDSKDLIILRELEKDSRKTFADLAPILDMTLQGVKYRFDKKLVASGVVENFRLDVSPYPAEMSAYYDLHVEFQNLMTLKRFYAYIPELFFIVGFSKVLKHDSMLLRVYILESQVTSLFEFLSELCRRRFMKSYSAVRVITGTEERTTIPSELFVDREGWRFAYNDSVSKLRQLA
jgi:DNA-binding Lrp family transcriptional regulator